MHPGPEIVDVVVDLGAGCFGHEAEVVWMMPKPASFGSEGIAILVPYCVYLVSRNCAVRLGPSL